ncbi:ATP-binding cassette domain-containing protein [Caulobacter sp. SLTY]|uniref:ABC transporter ATP-binding protein n=1 Tax=Caulobacter sp. SLTY TaxID=2683262 RepID=UPI0014125415|nr:ABC transporter ATP-binding protein [Caulobacter sp. SLTY]NBB16801.1 ATP-binding cassette domain-containing protein [Caulobacter sp. SLTY]
MSVEIRRLRRAYGPIRALDGVDLTLEAGTITCLLGPSGSGKSTLLRLIAGLEKAEGGEITIGGKAVSAPGVHLPAEKRGVGLVFQDYALFPHLDGRGNVAFGVAGLPAEERHRRTEDALAEADIWHRAEARPSELSGGEQQRVAIARALAPRPAVLLLDEPFSSLDGRLREQMRASLLTVLRDSGAAVLIVTHDPEEALRMGDRLALMWAGRVLQAGTPEDCYRRPVSVDAARLLGEANALPATVANGLATTAFGPVAVEAEGDMVIARPEAFRLSDQGMEAEVLERRFLGAQTHLRLLANNNVCAARVPSAGAPAVGDRVRVTLDPALCSVVWDDA